MRIGAVFGAVLLASALPAQAAPSPRESAAAAASEKLGEEMYAYDQAAWHATDSFQADAAKAGGVGPLMAKGLAGYIVEPVDGGLQATFYGTRDGTVFALARYAVSGSKVTGGGLLPEGAPNAMTPLSRQMIAARSKAIDAMAKPDHGLCSETAPNTLVLPPRGDGILSVYILTSTTAVDSYPAGGHYRFDFDSAGALVAERRFMKSCFPLNFGAAPNGGKPEMVVLTHLLDPQPTEIHAFVSRNIPVGLMVATISNRAIWAVAAGRIRYVQDIAP